MDSVPDTPLKRHKTPTACKHTNTHMCVCTEKSIQFEVGEGEFHYTWALLVYVKYAPQICNYPLYT